MAKQQLRNALEKKRTEVERTGISLSSRASRRLSARSQRSQAGKRRRAVPGDDDSDAAPPRSPPASVAAPLVVIPSKLRPTVGVSKSRGYAMCNPKSKYYDPTWPRPIRLGNGVRSTGWLADELRAWLARQDRTKAAA